MHRDTGRILGDATQVRTGRLTVVGSIWGVRKICLRIVIYKCNNFPEKYLPPPPQNLLDIVCTSLYNESKRRYIMTEEEYRQEEVDQVLSGEPLIHERNPDTDEVRTRRRIEPVQEPIYVNEMAEAVRILQRIEDKLDAAIGRMK